MSWIALAFWKSELDQEFHAMEFELFLLIKLTQYQRHLHKTVVQLDMTEKIIALCNQGIECRDFQVHVHCMYIMIEHLTRTVKM